ncbi:hypothetical protein JQ634_10710 [Bradyrhizobium sp. AUGA SZCCT0240]|uniref:hypothetical protein n=1 Tax=Bradyrhizobium sp. AUGA SZCCT0160 TaxID=2807662 RepID=UPI001BAE49A4|nr:hypothetical protein [Bradyrhizobium sp. AUGA SZCCT0160]MBR1187711.1 hypothetical protein [Bradyrhizobium sp. AUGA SZCCT0160]MBR1254174.1 hypothetical protein [Bradyrhizobium sp. AUGA SZCCT0240]
MLDAKHFGEPRLDHVLPFVFRARAEPRAVLLDFERQDAVSRCKSLPAAGAGQGIASMQKRAVVSAERNIRTSFRCDDWGAGVANFWVIKITVRPGALEQVAITGRLCPEHQPL